MSTLLPLYINTNRNGIPALRSLSVSVNANDVRFDFNNHVSVGGAFRGLVIVNLAQSIPDGTNPELPIIFTSNGGNGANLTTFDGENVEVDFIGGTGIYLVWVDTQSGVVQLLTGSLPN